MLVFSTRTYLLERLLITATSMTTDSHTPIYKVKFCVLTSAFTARISMYELHLLLIAAGCTAIDMATWTCSPLPDINSVPILALTSRYREEDCGQRQQNNHSAAARRICSSELYILDELPCVRPYVSHDNDAHSSC